MANEIIIGQTLDFSNAVKMINVPNGVDPGDGVNFGQLSAVLGALVFQGPYNANTNTPNLTTPAPGAVDKGYMYVVSVGGTFFGETVEVGDTLISNVNDPASLSDWTVLETNNAANLPTTDEKAAMTNANSPDAANPFATIADLAGAFITDYFVTSDYGSDANTGLSYAKALATLDAALTKVEAAGGGSITILDDNEYTISTQTMTVPFRIFHPKATLAGAGGGAVLRHAEHSIRGFQIKGDNLTFTGATANTESTHHWERILNPNLLYTNSGGDPSGTKYDIFAQEIDSAFGTGDMWNMTNIARMRLICHQSRNLYSSGTNSPYKINGSSSTQWIFAQNIDCAGGTTTNTVTVTGGALSWLISHCNFSTNVGVVDGAGSKLYVIATQPGGQPGDYIQTNGGVALDSSLTEGLNFDNLTATGGLSLTDIINTRNGSGQFSATLTQLKNLIVPATLPPNYVDEFGGTVSPTSAGVWEVVTLPSAPANTVVEVLADRIGNNTHGVRAVGSTNARERDIRQSGTFTVKTNGSGQIEIKSSNTSTTFRLFGKFV